MAISGFSISAFAELPTASEVAKDMGLGWNLGNSLEAPGGETQWGNPPVTPELIAAVKTAGFDTIRIPCAWNSYADSETHVIDPKWLTRVREIVDFALDRDMFVILNSHWDEGWLENHPFYKDQVQVNLKQKAYWTQIADYFSDCGERLLFAGTNEVHEHNNYGAPSEENVRVHESYLQTFVDAVRKTGGNNATRTLIVQSYNTNIIFALEFLTLPKDPAPNRLMVEIHHYDPYQFTLSTPTQFPYWGQPYTDENTPNWATEESIREKFLKLKAKWMDQGIPVIMGEYGVVSRSELNDQRQIDSRNYWLKFNTALALECGVIPVIWDNGAVYNGFALFDRETADVADPSALQAVIEAN